MHERVSSCLRWERGNIKLWRVEVRMAVVGGDEQAALCKGRHDATTRTQVGEERMRSIHTLRISIIWCMVILMHCFVAGMSDCR